MNKHIPVGICVNIKKMERVVITGLAAITPIGKNTMEYWNNLLNGDSGADKITRFDTTNFKTKFACEIKNYVSLRFSFPV